VFFGGNFAFSVIVFGWLPITFGLDFVGAATASLTGLLLGTAMIAPMALLGPRTGTNNTVSSAAHFGTRGRLIGSALTLLFALAYAAIAVWTSGDALVAAAERLLGVPVDGTTLAIGYAVISVEIVLVALFGHGTVVAMQKFVAPVVGILLLMGVIAFAPTFSPSSVHADYLLGDFWPTWILSAVISVGGPLSYAPTLGDYSRRVSRKHHSDRSVIGATCLGVFLGLFVTALFGAFTASAIPELGGSYVADLVRSAPAWYLLPILIIALAGGLGQGVLNLYASGLDLEALFPRLRRIHHSHYVGDRRRTPLPRRLRVQRGGLHYRYDAGAQRIRRAVGGHQRPGLPGCPPRQIPRRRPPTVSRQRTARTVLVQQRLEPQGGDPLGHRISLRPAGHGHIPLHRPALAARGGN
jgi:purine-cytosine permease-like protein